MRLAFINLTKSSEAALLSPGSHADTVRGASTAEEAAIGAEVVAGRATAGAVTSAFLSVVTSDGYNPTHICYACTIVRYVHCTSYILSLFFKVKRIVCF
jgi:hypothetical protein